MEINLKPGTYILAISGGVDSVVLLDLLHSNYQLQTTNYKLITAHFEHGIRPDSHKDREFVQGLAGKYNLEFVYEEGGLGPDASEDTARKARYDFLNKMLDKYNADAIITAHHQDDLLETAVLNILRGTGPRGLVSLKSNEKIIRPLLGYSKTQLIEYAEAKNLEWREDPSNQDLKYLRNYIRLKIIPHLPQEEKNKLLINIENTRKNLFVLDNELAEFFKVQPSTDALNRYDFIMLPHSASREVMADWLRRNGVTELSGKMIERLVMAAKTYAPGRTADVLKNKKLKIYKRILELEG